MNHNLVQLACSKKEKLTQDIGLLKLMTQNNKNKIFRFRDGAEWTGHFLPLILPATTTNKHLFSTKLQL